MKYEYKIASTADVLLHGWNTLVISRVTLIAIHLYITFICFGAPFSSPAPLQNTSLGAMPPAPTARPGVDTA